MLTALRATMRRRRLLFIILALAFCGAGSVGAAHQIDDVAVAQVDLDHAETCALATLLCAVGAVLLLAAASVRSLAVRFTRTLLTAPRGSPHPRRTPFVARPVALLPVLCRFQQ